MIHGMKFTIAVLILAWAHPAGSQAAMVLPRPQIHPPDTCALRGAIEHELVEFVQHNYPSCTHSVLRSLQNKEGKLQKYLTEAADFLTNMAQGPVTLEGVWREGKGRRQYLVVSLIRGLKGSSKTNVWFTTYPGFLRPFTVVQVDRDGDGKMDQQSSALCRAEGVRDWLLQHLTSASPSA